MNNRISTIGAQRHSSSRNQTMNNTIRITLVATALVIVQNTYAHDPAEHAREAAEAKKGADCAAMKNMDMSKMSPNDPVMKAMMAKCAPHADGHHEHAKHPDAPATTAPAMKSDVHGSH